MSKWNRRAALTAALLLCALPAFAADEATPDALEKFSAAASDLRIGVDTVWVLVTAMLVFWMNAGFALVESGLCQAKNTTNILAKNFIVFAASTISFWVLGWGLMFGDGNAFVGLHGLFFVGGADNSPALGEAYAAMNPFSTTAYQGVYSGDQLDPGAALGEVLLPARVRGDGGDDRVGRGRRAHQVRLVPGLQLPAGGVRVPDHRPLDLGRRSARRQQLPRLRRLDGRPLGRRLGGAGGAILVLGPRIGKYGKDGKVNPIPGHSMTSAALGVLILWLGWFGFNPGSTMAAMNGTAIAHILVNTNMAAATGALGATADGLDAARQAGPLDDPQRLSRRTRRDHGAVRVRVDRRGRSHRSHRRRPRGARGSGLRQGQARRPGRRALGAPRERHLGHARARSLLRQRRGDEHRRVGHRPLARRPVPGAAQGRALRGRLRLPVSRCSSGTRSS